MRTAPPMPAPMPAVAPVESLEEERELEGSAELVELVELVDGFEVGVLDGREADAVFGVVTVAPSSYVLSVGTRVRGTGWTYINGRIY
jgi:hypothetical protein